MSIVTVVALQMPSSASSFFSPLAVSMIPQANRPISFSFLLFFLFFQQLGSLVRGRNKREEMTRLLAAQRKKKPAAEGKPAAE